MWEAFAIVAVIVALIYWYLRPSVGRRNDQRYHEEDIRYHDAAYDFAILCVRGAEQWGESLLVNAADNGDLDLLDSFEEGENVTWAIIRRGHGVKVTGRAKKDYAVDALCARFPALDEEVADILIEEAVADEDFTDIEDYFSGFTIEGTDFRVINEATGEILISSEDPDNEEDSCKGCDPDTCKGCDPDTCKANCQKPTQPTPCCTDPLPPQSCSGSGITMVVDEDGHVEGGSPELERLMGQGVAQLRVVNKELDELEELDFIEDYNDPGIDVGTGAQEVDLDLGDTFAGKAADEEMARREQMESPISLPSEFLDLGESSREAETVNEALSLDDNELHLDFADEDDDETEPIFLDEEETELVMLVPEDENESSDLWDNTLMDGMEDDEEDLPEEFFTMAVTSDVIPAPETDEDLDDLPEITDADIVSDTEALILSLPPIDEDTADESSDSEELDLDDLFRR